MWAMVGGRDIQILLVEPDAAAARQATAILKRAKVHSHVTVATTPAEALAHLRRETNHYRSPRPNLILLSADDLPKGGEELLIAIKCDAKLAHIPVILMRSSAQEAEVTRAYDLDANCYVQKPMTDDEMTRVLETVRDFWLAIAKLPSD